jgi:hypothetical protein
VSITEQAGKVGTAAVSAMSSQPLAIALLIVNVAFLGFAGYVLGAVANNAQERNKSQMNLIEKLAGDIRDCRVGKPGASILRLPPANPRGIPVNEVAP